MRLSTHIKRIVVVALFASAHGSSAVAFNFQDWNPFSTTAKPVAGEIAYTIRLDVPLEHADLREQLQQASGLASASVRAAPSLAALKARATSDEEQLRANLFDLGYFGAQISTAITIVAAPQDQTKSDANAQIAEVVVAIAPGSLFHFGTISISTTSQVATAPLATPANYGLISGQPARASTIVHTLDRMIEEWRISGHPFVRITKKDITANHAAHVVDVVATIEPGPIAAYGWVNVTGTQALSPDFVSRYSALRPGQRFSSTDLRRGVERVRKLSAVESVKITPGKSLDASGGVPITLTVTERKPRFVGASAAVSSVDGGEVQAYWGHRNLFGNSETLKIEGGVSQIGDGGLPMLQYFAKVSLTKPGVLDIDTDLVTELGAAREHPLTYDSRFVKGKIGLVRRLSETATGSIAVSGIASDEDDALGRKNYLIATMPTEFIEDKRDNKLDPTKGWRTQVGLEPGLEITNADAFLIARGQLSGYVTLPGTNGVVLAGRVGLASILGADAANLPPSQRLYAGGGGSVRGYAFRSIIPVDSGGIGGQSLAEASIELRMRLTPTIGLVPFIDAATVSSSTLPTFSDVKVGAGLGLRYFTALGPIRLDVAVPVKSGADFSDVAYYVGLGQAF